MWLLVKIISRGLFAESLIVLLCTEIFCKFLIMFDVSAARDFCFLHFCSMTSITYVVPCGAIIYVTVLIIRVKWIDDLSYSSLKVKIFNAKT